MFRSQKQTLLALLALLSALPFAGVALAQARDEFGDETEEANVVQTVARVSYLQGTASYARGDQPDDWQPAAVNIPMTLGDRIYTSRRSRTELQVHGGDVIWLGSRSDFTALNLTEDTKQFALQLGIASLRIRQLDDNDVWEVDTPNAAITFDSAGDYRLDVDTDGNTHVSVTRGSATVAAGGGQIAVNAGEAMVVNGIDSPRYDFVPAFRSDAWDRWIDTRYGRVTRSASYHYVSPDIGGADDLDEYGSWSSIPDYGMAWAPSRIEVGWGPYRAGHWGWQDPWGWTWISTEPWGWAPYHYGRWVTYSSRWYWVPVAASVRRVAYAPALVAFVGEGPGFSASLTVGGGGYVGWFPLGPREPYSPWWSPRPAVDVNVTNVTYINKTYVTVVNQNTFVSGGLVARGVVTDRNVIRQVSAAPVVRGTMPVVPTLASTRFSVSTEKAVARPAAASARPVVARMAPPPAPPRFQQKLQSIQETRKPVDPAAAARLVAQTQREPRASVQVRPVASESGRVTLTQGRTSASVSSSAPRPAPAPVSVAPVRGRAQATAQQPVSSEPVSARKPGAQRESTAPAARPDTSRQPAQPAQAEPRPTAVERREAEPPARPTIERQVPQREVATPARPQTQSAPQQRPEERLRATPQTEDRSRPNVERPTTPNWRDKARPTPREAPAREATPDRSRSTDSAAQRQQQQQQQQQRDRSAQERPREATPAPAQSRERDAVRPNDNQRPAEHPTAAPGRSTVDRPEKGRPTPRPVRTAKPDDKKPDEKNNP